jgi:hypothetical protein
MDEGDFTPAASKSSVVDTINEVRRIIVEDLGKLQKRLEAIRNKSVERSEELKKYKDEITGLKRVIGLEKSRTVQDRETLMSLRLELETLKQEHAQCPSKISTLEGKVSELNGTIGKFNEAFGVTPESCKSYLEITDVGTKIETLVNAFVNKLNALGKLRGDKENYWLIEYAKGHFDRSAGISGISDGGVSAVKWLQNYNNYYKDEVWGFDKKLAEKDREIATLKRALAEKSASRTPSKLVDVSEGSIEGEVSAQSVLMQPSRPAPLTPFKQAESDFNSTFGPLFSSENTSSNTLCGNFKSFVLKAIKRLEDRYKSRLQSDKSYQVFLGEWESIKEQIESLYTSIGKRVSKIKIENQVRDALAPIEKLFKP